MTTYCCDAFKELANAGRNSGAEPDEKEGVWNVNGCCGGGCYIIIDMRFCPYCGSALAVPTTIEESHA